MQKKGSSNRLPASPVRSRNIPTLLLFMLATFASIYIAGRLWQDSQYRVQVIKQLDGVTVQEKSAISVDDTLKIIACREQQRKLSAVEEELAAAAKEGFSSKRSTHSDGIDSKKKLMLMIGILTKFDRKNNRDAIRKAWMGAGPASKKMEEERGIVARFVIGKSLNQGDGSDGAIATENMQTNDFIILDKHIEAPAGLPEKTKLFFAYAAEKWNAEFYAKVNDDVYVNIDAIGSTLAAHLDKPRVYIGCMKSGEVFSELNNRWYEPDWWKFGDKKAYFRHASGEMYAISQALAQFISINRSILRTYAHDDVSAGSWFIGLDVKHVDEAKFCCSSSSSDLTNFSSRLEDIGIPIPCFVSKANDCAFHVPS
ncbi:hypothetical protein ACFE04_028843 [Oxalis oulophora]